MIGQEDIYTNMVTDKEKDEIKDEVRYLSNKTKIKELLNHVRIEDVMKYLIEHIDSMDIDSDEDLWKFRVADSLEDAYDHYINRLNYAEN